MPSFDAVSEVDLQEVDNAVNQAIKEIHTRYDFRGSRSSVEFDKIQKIIRLQSEDEFKMKAVIDILQTKAVKRNISPKSLDVGKIDVGGGLGMAKCTVKLVCGIEQEKAKDIVRTIKDAKMKVQAQIQEDAVRVSGKKRDDLQEAMALLRSKDFGIPLQFKNFRD